MLPNKHLSWTGKFVFAAVIGTITYLSSFLVLPMLARLFYGEGMGPVVEPVLIVFALIGWASVLRPIITIVRVLLTEWLYDKYRLDDDLKKKFKNRT